jgi:ankyrin repeat protein
MRHSRKLLLAFIITALVVFIAVYLPIYPGGQSLLHIGVIQRNINLVKFLLVVKADVNQRDHLMNTPLHYAVYSPLKSNSSVELVKLLVCEGANINCHGRNGNTALHIACEYRLEPTVRLLLRLRANPNTINNQCLTPIFIATICGRQDIVNFLAANGANVNSRDNVGRVPMTYAFSIKQSKVYLTLLSFKADTNLCDNNGNTLLHYAVTASHVDAVRLLIQQGLINRKNNRGETPLYNAYDPLVARILLDNGANLAVRNSQNKTPLEYAMSCHRNDVSKLISKYQGTLSGSH